MTIPPSHNTTVRLKTEIAYGMQDVLDKMLENDENYVHLLISYPSMDQDYAKFAWDDFGQFRVPFLRSERLPALNEYVRINGATTATFTFTIDEPYLDRISIYAKNPPGSTSWFDVYVYNSKNQLILRKIVKGVELIDEQWFDIRVGKLIQYNSITGSTETIRVLLVENEFGTNPIGIDIGKNGANIAYRISTSKVSKVYGKIASGVMRFTIYAKDKKKGRNPNSAFFISKNDIVMQLIDLLRKFIRSIFVPYGLIDLTQTSLNDDEASNSTPYASGIIDVIMEVPDFATPETPMLPLKQLNISDIKNV